MQKMTEAMLTSFAYNPYFFVLWCKVSLLFFSRQYDMLTLNLCKDKSEM